MIPEQPESPGLSQSQPRRGIPGWLWVTGWVMLSVCICVVGLGGAIAFFRMTPLQDGLWFPTPRQVQVTAPPPTWQNSLSDPFVSNQNRWNEDDENYVEGRVQRKIDQFVYHWDVTNEVDQLWFDFPGVDFQLDDVYVSVEANMTGQSQPGMKYGLLFRYANSDNFYMMVVTANGYWQLESQVADTWNNLTPLRRTQDLLPGGTNKLAVLAQGTTITAFINDQVQGQVNDDQVPKGKVGLIVGSDRGQQMIIDFDNFEVYAP